MATPPKLDLSASEIVELDDFGLCDHIWQLVSDEYYEQEEDDDPPCDYPESLFAAKLPEPWWTAYGVHAFAYDVAAGGLKQFLDNHRGLTNEKTAEALVAVGFPELAAAFRKVGAKYLAIDSKWFSDGVEVSDEDFEKADLEIDQLVASSGEDFGRLEREADLRGNLAKYIRANIAAFMG